MLSGKQIRTWYLVHKWTSLVCTVFLLLLCITGLPLILYEEIEHTPLKIIWALLDIATIAVLVSGLSLWFGRHRWKPVSPSWNGVARSLASADEPRPSAADYDPAERLCHPRSACPITTGLLSALVGAGAFDIVSWAVFALPLAFIAWALSQCRHARS